MTTNRIAFIIIDHPFLEQNQPLCEHYFTAFKISLHYASYYYRLDVFTDKEFRNQLETDSAISIHEGTRLFGELGILTITSDLRVSLNDCKLTPTSNANDPTGQIVIQNG